ncbi:MAG: hypothetical protein BWY76_00720 [bacterium ADurb.Bin429]|nr:MAG: hypothetical protein BWY76_00720 [bacterium ADurb.Bin429]
MNWQIERGTPPFQDITEPLAEGAAHVLTARAEWEQRALNQNSVSAQIPYDPAVMLGQEVTLALENGDRAGGVVTYVEHLIRDGQAVTRVKVLPEIL